jgi:hypothetical protein
VTVRGPCHSGTQRRSGSSKLSRPSSASLSATAAVTVLPTLAKYTRVRAVIGRLARRSAIPAPPDHISRPFTTSADAAPGTPVSRTRRASSASSARRRSRPAAGEELGCPWPSRLPARRRRPAGERETEQQEPGEPAQTDHTPTLRPPLTRHKSARRHRVPGSTPARSGAPAQTSGLASSCRLTHATRRCRSRSTRPSP